MKPGIAVLVVATALAGVPGPGTVRAMPVAAPPGATETLAEGPELGSVRMPRGPVTAGAVVPDTVSDTVSDAASGMVETRAWRIEGGPAQPLGLIRDAEAGLAGMGYEPVFDCAAALCGGFDFRFALSLAKPPQMEVDLDRYHYLLMQRGEEQVALFASVTGDTAYLQAISVQPAGEMNPLAPGNESGDAAVAALLGRLQADGAVTLTGIDFTSGAAEFAPGAEEQIALIARVLAEDAALRIAVVGHTDTTGSLAANLDLSKARARAVRARLIDGYGIDAARIAAEGVGPLAPVTNNASDESRARNRRVDVVLME